MSKRTYIVLGIAGILLVGLGYFMHAAVSKTPETSTNSDEVKNYPLLAKRIFVDEPNETRINFSPLRTALRGYFDTNKINGSLYFEYLPTGTSIRINGDQRFRGASLIKLPVAMEIYKAQELGTADLGQKVQLKQEWLNDGFGDLYKRGVGYELTLGEATKIMLTESDNTALRVVAASTETALENKDRALGSLDIEFSESNEDGGIDIGTRSYSSFLKCLYFACYNTKEDSQQILDYLTQTKFNNRLVAGIPDKDVKVAHKIGVFNTQVQSDCGVVYVDKNNYVLCVMINGDNTDQINGHIAEISRIVYTYITQSQ